MSTGTYIHLTPPPPLYTPGVVREAQVAADDVLEQALRGLLRALGLADHHVAQHGTHGEKTLSGGADVVESNL